MVMRRRCPAVGSAAKCPRVGRQWLASLSGLEIVATSLSEIQGA